MRAGIGIMVEGQEGLTWERWRRLCEDVERLGFSSLRRSDHFFSVMGASGRESLETWVSLALAAEWTRRIELGPMVCSMTFRPPALLARMAAAVDELAGGRLILGVGAGWHEAEHEAFAIPFPSLRERFDLLERGIEVMERTWRTSAPRPPRGGRIPLLIGGSGERRTLGLAARHAAEWNAHGLDEEAYAAKARVLEERCREVRRDPATIRRSLMSGFLVGRDRHDLRERAARMAAFLPGYEGLEPDELLRRLGPLWLVGTPEEIVDRMRGYVRYGVDLFMLQHFLMDDADALQVLAAEVMPALASG